MKEGIEMVENIRKLLIDNNVKLNNGMTKEDIIKAEKFYNIQFPNDMKEMLMNFVPISESFYNWNDYSEENITKIKKMMEWPFEGIIFDIQENNFWLEELGECPEKIDDRINKFRKYQTNIPKLIPLFAHRYVVSDRNINYPIISVYQADIIYYGKNILEYFDIEFNHANYIANIAEFKEIPFWSKIINL